MRTIEFRGKRTDNGEWVYGDLKQIKNIGSAEIFVESTDMCVPNEYIEVDPATVGQFTGLFDKNGKEIYEGDLYQVAKNLTYEVRWMEGEISDFEWYGGCFALFRDAKIFFPFDEYSIRHGEVIGNIHNNPKLTSSKRNKTM